MKTITKNPFKLTRGTVAAQAVAHSLSKTTVDKTTNKTFVNRDKFTTGEGHKVRMDDHMKTVTKLPAFLKNTQKSAPTAKPKNALLSGKQQKMAKEIIADIEEILKSTKK